jgi:YD repeat-containing protein
VSEPRPFSELPGTGLLWLINRVVFHPRGWALAFHYDDRGELLGWSLIGDGAEVWSMDPKGEDETFAKVQALLTPQPTAEGTQP